jgi:hypothetical protein
VLAGEAPHVPAPVARPAPQVLPPAERRRSAPLVGWTLTVAQEAVNASGLAPADFSVVFASSDGDGDIVHRLCTAMAGADAAVSPTDFHNSVHNAATGYWGIGARSSAPSTAICACDNSFAAGLLEAACQVAAEKRPVLLVAVDLPYPPPLAPFRPVANGFAVALALVPGNEWEISTGGNADESPLSGFEGNAAAAALPLLAALARAGEAIVNLPGGLQVRKRA